MTWGEVPPVYHHGEVTGYRVFLEETVIPGVVITNRTFSLDVNSTDFTGLKKFTKYTARVRAYSFFGEGPEDTITALTDEDSELYLFIYLFVYLFIISKSNVNSLPVPTSNG